MVVRFSIVEQDMKHLNSNSHQIPTVEKKVLGSCKDYKTLKDTPPDDDHLKF